MGFGSVLHAKRLPLPVRPRSQLLATGIAWAVAWLSPFTKPCLLLCLHTWTEKSSSDLGGDGISGLRHLHYVSKENRHHRNFVKFDKGTTRQTGTEWIYNPPKLRSICQVEFYQLISDGDFAENSRKHEGTAHFKISFLFLALRVAAEVLFL